MTDCIPIVDFTKWYDPRNAEKDRHIIAHDLVEACRRAGFVYIINHRVTNEELTESFEWSRKFYGLTKEQKSRVPRPQAPNSHRGWSRPGEETAGQLDQYKDDMSSGPVQSKVCSTPSLSWRHPDILEESYEVGSDSNPSNPNVWPPGDLLPGFRAFMEPFYCSCEAASKDTMAAFALGLRLPDSKQILESHSGHDNQMRLQHYPAEPADALRSEKVARMPAHTDWGSFTFLFQDDCGGLQVERPTARREFVEATPIENAMVVTVGDMLERWTNGRLKATLHRVGLPASQNRVVDSEGMTRERFSIVYFVLPRDDAIVEVLPTFENGQHAVNYPPVTWKEYYTSKLKLLYSGRS